jgi:hypothetical protein
MAELLKYLTAYEVWIYFVLGAVGLIYLRKFVIALQEWQGAMFGLEKNIAQRRLSAALSLVFLLLLLAGGEFAVVSFVAPNYASLAALPTPTLDLLLTPTVTVPGEMAAQANGTGTPSATEAIESSESHCQPGKLAFIFPKAGDELSTDQGVIELTGTVTIPDNFGYYKYEYALVNAGAPVQEQDWVTIQANDCKRGPGQKCQKETAVPSQAPTKSPDQKATQDPNDDLGPWDLSQLSPGDYLLRLVATDNEGKAMPACQIPLRITAPAVTPES